VFRRLPRIHRFANREEFAVQHETLGQFQGLPFDERQVPLEAIGGVNDPELVQHHDVSYSESWVGQAEDSQNVAVLGLDDIAFLERGRPGHAR
jgi:hypothetical protein